jgi:hypothetical protein
MFGAMLPDIDCRYSTIGKYNPFTGLMKHRGHCHTLGGILLLSAPFLVFGMYPAAFILTGAATHLAGDKLQSLLRKNKKQFKIKVW